MITADPGEAGRAASLRRDLQLGAGIGQFLLKMIDLLFLLIQVLLIRFGAAVGRFQGAHVLSQLRVLRLQFLNLLNRLFQSPPPGLACQRPQLMEIPAQTALSSSASVRRPTSG